MVKHQKVTKYVHDCSFWKVNGEIVFGLRGFESIYILACMIWSEFQPPLQKYIKPKNFDDLMKFQIFVTGVFDKFEYLDL